MTRTIRTLPVLLLVAMFAATGCSSGGGDQTADTQEKFGVRMARMNLWREAQFRFLRSVQLNPEDAMAHNNLAVAYEANGDFENAMKEYREAIRLDKSNQYIQKNYSRFVEFTSRNRKRQQRAPKPGETPAAATTTEKTAAPPAKPAAPADTPAPPAAAAPPDSSGTSTPGSSTSPQPASTAPANVPPSPPPQPISTPPETQKPPGDLTS